MENKNKNEYGSIPLSYQHQIRYITKIVFNLNMLAFDLPIRIDIIDDRKAYSDEWLKENGFGHMTLPTLEDFSSTHK